MIFILFFHLKLWFNFLVQFFHLLLLRLKRNLLLTHHTIIFLPLKKWTNRILPTTLFNFFSNQILPTDTFLQSWSLRLAQYRTWLLIHMNLKILHLKNLPRNNFISVIITRRSIRKRGKQRCYFFITIFHKFLLNCLTHGIEINFVIYFIFLKSYLRLLANFFF